MRGSPLGTWKNFPQKFLKWDLWSVTVPKNVKEGGPLGFFDIHFVAKCRKKWRDPLVQSKKFLKQSHSAEKKWGYGGILSVISGFWTYVLFLLFVLCALLRFELLRFDVVEQMNKKVDFTRLKKLPTVIVGHIFYNAPTQKGALGILKIQFVAKYWKKWRGPFGDIENVSKKSRKAEKNHKGDRFCKFTKKKSWLKQGLEPATAGFPLNTLSENIVLLSRKNW